MDYLISYDLDGQHITERTEPDELDRIQKVAKGHGAKNIAVVLNKSGAKKTASMLTKHKGESKLDLMKRVAAAPAVTDADQAAQVAAQDYLRETFGKEVAKAKSAGVFNQQGAQFVGKDVATMDADSYEPREVDMPETADYVGDSDSVDDGDYQSNGVNVDDINEATQAWLAGDTRPARELGLSESDIERWLAQTRVPVQMMGFGGGVRNVGLDNVETANELDDAIQEIKPKSAGALRTSQKLGRPSSFTR